MPRPIVELMRLEARFYRWLARGGSEPARGSRDRGLPPERGGPEVRTSALASHSPGPTRRRSVTLI